MEFRTNLNELIGAYAYGLNVAIGKANRSDQNTALNGANLTVLWTLEVEPRERGVKGIYIYITKVYGTLEVEHWEAGPKDSDETIEVDLEKFEWKYECEMEVSKDGFAPTDVEIDFNTKIITVS